MDSTKKGSYEGWNDLWTEQSNENFVNPMFTESSPKTIYQFWQQGYAYDLLALIKDRNYKSFCELGSGRGTTTMYLAKAGYKDLTLVDLAEQGFKVAKHSFKHHGLVEPKMILEDVEKTSLKEDSFDCIYNIGLLEHFDDPGPTLSEALRLLKPGGLIFMPIVPEQPIRKSIVQRLIFNPIKLLKLVAKKLLKTTKKESAINRTNYRRSFYIKLCEDLGYKNIKCIPYNPYWKVNSDGRYESRITLPSYKWYYNTFKKKNTLSFKTSDFFDLCYLLYAEK